MATMRPIPRIVVALALLASGCRFPWEPRSGAIEGAVRYPWGEPVYMAKVSIKDVGTTYTDMMGRYRIELPVPMDSVVVVATDGYTPGAAYADTRSGSSKVAVRGGLAIVNVILDHTDPI